MKTIYVRVSTTKQNVGRQLEDKTDQVYWDKITGTIPTEFGFRANVVDFFSGQLGLTYKVSS